jgi:hypothetical protein
MSPEAAWSEHAEESSQERWEVFQQPDGHWRWRWLPSEEESDEADPIVSGETFESPDEAEESAQSAFPDLPGSVDRPRPTVAAAREVVSKGTTWARRGMIVSVLLAAGYLVGRRKGREVRASP